MTTPTGAFTETYVVESNYDGWRLDRYLTEKLKRASRSQVRRIIEHAVRFDDGRRVKPGTTVRAGDVVCIDRVERGDPDTPELRRVTPIFASDTLLVLDKPAGLLVHRTAREATKTIERYLEQAYPNERIEPAHRLDRDTSGVLLCGRGEDAIRRLREGFRDGAVTKTYTAWVTDPDALWSLRPERMFDTPLGLDPESALGVRMGVGDLPCRTHADLIAHRAGVSKLRVRIEQGRQHQIRAHLWLAGTPIVGDKLYAMGDGFFRAWADAPGTPELVAALDARWHCLHSAEARLRWQGVDHAWHAPEPDHAPF